MTIRFFNNAGDLLAKIDDVVTWDLKDNILIMKGEGGVMIRVISEDQSVLIEN